MRPRCVARDVGVEQAEKRTKSDGCHSVRGAAALSTE